MDNEEENVQKKVVGKPVAEAHSKDLSVDGKFKKRFLQK
jgi:hypothetical protein